MLQMLVRRKFRQGLIGDKMKYKLYIDFDGVIWDSWPYLYKFLKESNVTLYEKVLAKSTTLDDDKKIGKIFNSMNWEDLIKNTHPINNSIEKLKSLYYSDLFDVSILTHCNCDSEVKCKRKLLESAIPGINIITVFKPTHKSEVVDPVHAILIDDYVGNLNDWKNAGGIAVKFTTKSVVNGAFYCINSLDQINDIISELEFNDVAVEKLIEAAA
jgi:hypothetical protein